MTNIDKICQLIGIVCGPTRKTTLFSGHYLCNRLSLDIGVLGYIGILYHKEHPPKVWHIPPGTSCIYEELNGVALEWEYVALLPSVVASD
jgi:hypothetical protein